MFRIHGDNIIECDRCLELIAQAFAGEARLLASDPFCPRFAISVGNQRLLTIDLVPGHGRWQLNLQQMLRDHGAPLREATDVLLTKVSSDGKTETMLAAVEFCSALPAGNNAWQRNGRALACASVGIPYLYFAELGGLELSQTRSVKAPRFPNPIVPFSYLTASRTYRVVCLPVYAPSPSSNAEMRATFASCFGVELGQRLLRALMEDQSLAQTGKELTVRALLTVEILSNARVRADTLRGKQWTDFLNQPTAQDKANWLEALRTAWARRLFDKVALSTTFPRLVKLFEESSSLSIGASRIPICLIPQARCRELSHKVQHLYGGSLASDFTAWLGSSERPLVVVWVTGFKPRGDDSRPDRGLVPLARMLFGNDVRILCVVSGPGKREMWREFRRDPAGLARVNGLWEAVFNLSDAILADSATIPEGPHALLTNRDPETRKTLVAFPAATCPIGFSEHDVDSALHLLFSRLADLNVFEVMCNPPGGDWSGVTLRDFVSGAEYRWTSLPRVSGKDRKRPDHVAQITQATGKTNLVAIESKDNAANLENRVGLRMKKFLGDLLRNPPIISRPAKGEWAAYSGAALTPVSGIISAGAFCWDRLERLENALQRGELDIVFAFEFHSGEQPSLLHITARQPGEFLIPLLRKAAEKFDGRLEIQVH